MCGIVLAPLAMPELTVSEPDIRGVAAGARASAIGREF
jgi:hypothetical protein